MPTVVSSVDKSWDLFQYSKYGLIIWPVKLFNERFQFSLYSSLLVNNGMFIYFNLNNVGFICFIATNHAEIVSMTQQLSQYNKVIVSGMYLFFRINLHRHSIQSTDHVCFMEKEPFLHCWGIR